MISPRHHHHHRHQRRTCHIKPLLSLIISIQLSSNPAHAGFNLKQLFSKTKDDIPATVAATTTAQDDLDEKINTGFQNATATAAATSCDSCNATPFTYGVDLSFPMHHERASQNYAWLPNNVDPENNPTPEEFVDVPVQYLGDRQSVHEEYMEGCRKKYPGSDCDMNEEERIAMNLRQPQSMQNYTELGFKKIRAPDHVFSVIKSFWEQNRHLQYDESWPTGNIYTNHWASPTRMLSVEDPKLPGGGQELKKQIWDLARDTIQEWTGEVLTPCSLYGIRVYEEGSILSPHVDRLPLVSSAIINVAQDVDEDWPIEVIGHDGKAHNVTMEPGDMVLYESHSVIHGRPFALKGRYYANVFIHFEPTGHTIRHEAKMSEGDDDDTNGPQLPAYIIPGTPEEEHWRASNAPRAEKVQRKTTGATPAHTAAAYGILSELKKLAEYSEDILWAKDSNGWMPITEAARSGELDVIKYLLEFEEIRKLLNEKTHRGTGYTVTSIAEDSLGSDHEVVIFLKSQGGLLNNGARDDKKTVSENESNEEDYGDENYDQERDQEAWEDSGDDDYDQEQDQEAWDDSGDDDYDQDQEDWEESGDDNYDEDDYDDDNSEEDYEDSLETDETEIKEEESPQESSEFNSEL